MYKKNISYLSKNKFIINLIQIIIFFCQLLISNIPNKINFSL